MMAALQGAEVASARSARKPAVWTLCRGLYRVVEVFLA